MRDRWAAARRILWAHVQTWRPYTLCYPVLVGVAGAGAGGAAGLAAFVVAGCGVALGWLAGHYLGDYFDRELDRIAKPQRPIPSGRLAAKTALACGIGLAVAAAVLLAWVNWRTLVLVVLALAGIVAYSRFCKARGFSGNLVRGLITALGFLIGAMVAAPLPGWPAVAFSAVFLLHDAASNLVGTLRDVDGDRAAGYRSVPVRSGVRYAAGLAVSLYVAAILIAAIGLLLPHRPGFPVLLGVAACVGLVAVLPLPFLAPNLGQARALRAHEFLVAERLVLAGAVLARTAPAAVVVPLLALVLVFSLWTQAVMRSRHEIPADDMEVQPT
ncbi:4-hydroxybenzoate polyprenyltransferase/geranylgeranylglycerol-phosphate geranylgeranyltransferase [Saccharopolyspora antimicrobica]|uniref:4-hydroxybenzoate polyprenyltransferase/geranylgeranylglycerol-phosphate geranylgeranyltransferase n=1 Tax=Saccharopolyspora antimicrobica TaxID=455193 RepID=A0A1I5KZC7_9PSEU|nr:UbiA family prenyltransferase [Saccharopolyspora antimicrobica]RKT89077.1 4-hydroxybenzoate polyprenyltransferase/geranylgeranylglycerol-phosphate geranylgeranyltransferase [Saccharopolyspora antimicrobica]SFO90258.1 4-hydroxybenzoate polyprenyltransferase/geranylgeranylglycerol-phosphate geranylgeranyltransferase [Saccharopolyspora antimicrobica]